MQRMPTAPLGTCKLCLSPDVVLRDSHYIPKGVYRQLRETGGCPDPWRITSDHAVRTSKQLKAHLLCDSCEDRLSRLGEDWVMKHFLRADDTFRLQDILERHRAEVRLDGEATRVYLAAVIPEIDVAALTYFAASIFWRGSIHGWDESGHVPVSIGPYGEPMRRYLVGKADFPEHVALHIAVRERGQLSRLTATPVGKRLGAVRVYKFPLPGLALSIAVGKGLTDQMRRYCFVRGHGHPIAVTPLLEPILQRDAVNYLRRHKKT
jgi:hypothetical protein